MLIADHVQQRGAADDGRGEVGPLGERGPDQHAAVRAAHDRQLPVGRPAPGHLDEVEALAEVAELDDVDETRAVRICYRLPAE